MDKLVILENDRLELAGDTLWTNILEPYGYVSGIGTIHLDTYPTLRDHVGPNVRLEVEDEGLIVQYSFKGIEDLVAPGSLHKQNVYALVGALGVTPVLNETNLGTFPNN